MPPRLKRSEIIRPALLVLALVAMIVILVTLQVVSHS